jgi:hypothetical protein
MKREEFVAKVVREAEKKLQLPPGWWGNWRHVHGPEGEEVKFNPSRSRVAGMSVWVAKVDKIIVAIVNDRAKAISKAKKWRST